MIEIDGDINGSEEWPVGTAPELNAAAAHVIAQGFAAMDQKGLLPHGYDDLPIQSEDFTREMFAAARNYLLNS